MHREKVRRIINELVSFSLELKATEINIKLNEINNRIKIEITNNASKVDKTIIKKLKNKLSTPRLVEIEELYWELAGENRQSDQLYLIGSMTDHSNVNYVEDKGLEVILYRVLK
jgi:hypothetical protein